MKNIKLWPHVTIIVILCALVGGVVGAFLVRQEQPAEAQALPKAARVERVDGDVALNRGPDVDQAGRSWVETTPNTPISVGDRIYTRDNSRASIAFSGRNFARLDPDSSLDVLSLSDRRTQLALRDGSAIFNLGELEDDELFEVATPYGAVDLEEPGLYQIGIDDNGSTIVSVLSGLAQVVGLAGSGQISKGEMLTLLGQTAAQIALSRLDPGYAGGIVDDYYGYQYPDTYDGRYSDYNAYLNDPYYYDPYNRYASYQYVSDAIPGVYQLDSYGDWRDVDGYGYAWSPRVDAGWAPYQQGYWSMDDLYGLTWISNEPWGYAPYHYGRWAYVNNQWFWVPERVNTEPVYSPALVAFVPLTQANAIGWLPLGPGDQYVTTYYDANGQPVYLTQKPASEQQFVNLYTPGAVTVVPVEDFNGVIDQRKLKKFDRQAFAQTRPVLDPFAIDSLRQAAAQNGKARRKLDVPQDVVRRLDERRVITSTEPVAPPFRKEMAKALRVESVPEKQRKEKLQFKDNRQAGNAQQQAGAPRQPQTDETGRANAAAENQERKQRIDALAAEAARGNKEAGRQARELERQQREQVRAQQQAARRAEEAQGRAQAENARAAQRAEGARVAEQMRAQREAARGQAAAEQQQQRAARQQQIEARRQAGQQAAAQRAERGRAQQQAQPRQQVIQQQAPQKAQKQQGGGQPQKQQGGGGGQPQSPKGGGGGKGKGRP